MKNYCSARFHHRQQFARHRQTFDCIPLWRSETKIGNRKTRTQFQPENNDDQRRDVNIYGKIRFTYFIVFIRSVGAAAAAAAVCVSISHEQFFADASAARSDAKTEFILFRFISFRSCVCVCRACVFCGNGSMCVADRVT